MSENALNPPIESRSSRVIHGYSLLEELGRGSFATAYRAEKDGQEYCVRELDTRRIDPRRLDEAVKLFIRENQVLAGLDHPRIPKVYDVFDETKDGELLLYQVQDLVPGVCLKSLVHPEQSFAERTNGEKIVRPFSEEQVVDIGLKLSRILVYLHNQPVPVVHRDVKPSNIMLNPPAQDHVGDVYLIDFGAVQQALITLEGGSTTFGTPGYAPMELYAAQATPKSDLYMLGMTMLHLASGIDPKEISDYLNRVAYKDTFRFKNPSLEAVVDHIIQPDPENRPESAEQVVDYLEKIKAGKQISRPNDDTKKVWIYLARLVPDILLRHLVRTKRDVVDKARRESHVLISDVSDASPRIEVLNGEAKIEKTDEHLTFYNVPLVNEGNKEAVLRFTRGLLFDGANLQQEEYVQRLQGSDLALPTVPEYLSLAAYLEQFQNHPDQGQNKLFKESKAWLKKMFEDYWLMTGTRGIYHPDGSGEVIQSIGRDNAFTTNVSALVGPDEWIKNMANPNETIEALCGTGDTAYVHQSFKDISGKDSYVWRINQNQPQKQERPVVLGSVVYYGRFGIGAVSYDYINYRRALGVVTQRAKNFQERGIPVGKVDDPNPELNPRNYKMV